MTDLRAFVRDIPDFPSPGILFRDITPLLASPVAFQEAVAAMAEPFRAHPPDKVLGIEARGFMFGAALAQDFGVGFVPVRKPGKLPRETFRVSYGLEYARTAWKSIPTLALPAKESSSSTTCLRQEGQPRRRRS